MELLYELSSLKDLNTIKPDDDITIRWLDEPDDFSVFYEHLRERCAEIPWRRDDWLKWKESGIRYCGLFKDGKMIARAACEPYSPDKWETGDVRVWKSERGQGYAKQVCWFVTYHILTQHKTATCRTEEDNTAMQKVILALGFRFVEKI